MERLVVEQLVKRLGGGDREALDSLVAVVYSELHRMARSVLQSEDPSDRTRPTSLVNQLYVELRRQGTIQASSQEHFFYIAVYLMRQMLVARARARGRAKRGGAGNRALWEEAMRQETPLIADPEELLALDEALVRLEAMDPVKAQVVELRYFGDLSIDATAAVMGVSTATVKRHWNVARLWLYRELTGEAGAPA